MNKIFLACIFFLAILLFLPKDLVFSQNTPASLVPGLDCGNAEGTGDAKKCCKKTSILQDPSGLTDQIKNIPLIGDKIIGPVDFLRSSALQLERSNSVVPCPIGYPSKINDPNCECLLSSQVIPSPVQSIKKMCSDYFGTSKERKSCDDCADKGGVWTGLGICVQGNIGNFIRQFVFGWAIGLAGMIVLLCIIYSAFQLQTSQGNPEKIKKAQEALSSCVIGLILIILSVFILRIIGVDILKIPGFRK